MTQFTIEIEHIKGEDRKDTMRRVQRMLLEEGRRKGIENASYSRTISDIVDALRESDSNQYITIRDGRNGGRISRRTPKASIPLAIKTPVKELDNYIQDSLPDAIYGKMLNLTPRELALQEALKTQVGVSSKLRVPHMEPEERLLAANIVGSLPTGGYGIEQAAKKQLSATVKQALGDLGIDTASNKGRLLERLQAKPFFNDTTLIANFSNMIRAYHDVRENNLHYMQSIITGMPKTKDAELLTNSILPTPDNILNGATAYLIFDTKKSLNIDDISSFIDAFVRKLLNYEDTLVTLKASEKEQQIGRFLAAFDFNRGAAAKALEEATLKAIKTGGDFIDSYLAEIDKATVDDDSLLQTALSAKLDYDDRLDADSEPFPLADDVKEDEKKKLVEYLVKNKLAFPIKPTAKKLDDNLFLLIPLQLPSFENNPIGWDRRWMIATMKIVDEYWPMIYGEDRKVLLSDLLYLIAARAKELFNYDIDVVQMTILALLLTDTRKARRKARSILPKSEKGEPLRSLRSLLRESTFDEPKLKSREQELRNLYMEIAKDKQALKAKDDEDKKNKIGATDALKRLIAYLDDALEELIAENYGNTTEQDINGDKKSIQDHTSDYKKAIDGHLKDIIEILDDDDFEFFSELKGLDKELNTLSASIKKYDPLKKNIKENADSLAYDLFVSDPDIFGLPDAGIVEMAKELGVRILKDPKDPTKGNRDINEIKDDLRQKRGAKSRRLLRNPPSGRIGHVTAEVVMGVNIVKDILAFGRDIVGGRSKTIEKKVQQTQKLLIEELHKKGEAMGGTSLRDIRIEPFTYGSSNSVIVLLGSADVHNESGSKKKAKSNPPASCPLATQDLKVNTKNRDSAIKAPHIQYGPLNLNDNDYWVRYGKKWNTTPEVAKESNCSNCLAFDISPRMKDCMPGDTYDKDGELGYCWMHHFKCHSARTCYTWAADGPIDLDSVSLDFQKRAESAFKNPPEFTPDYAEFDSRTLASTHAQGKFVDANTRQPAPVGYVVFMWEHSPGKYRVSDQYGQLPEKLRGSVFAGDSKVTAFMKTKDGVTRGNLRDIFMHPDFISNPPNTDQAILSALKEPMRGILRYGTSLSFPTNSQLGILVMAKSKELTGKDPYGPFRGLPEENRKALENWFYINYNTKFTVYRESQGSMYADNIVIHIERPKEPVMYRGEMVPQQRKHLSGILSNPPSSERKYKGVIIKKVEGGWNVEAYDKTLPTLAKAREFISSKVKGSAKPNQRCIRIISGIQCKGTVIKMNKGPHYRCKDCGAKYKAV